MTTGPIFTGEDWALDMPMSDEQKFIFDLKGWLLIPGVLNDAEIATVKEPVSYTHLTLPTILLV